MRQSGFAVTPDETRLHGGLSERPPWGVILLCWLILALAYTPAVVLTSPSPPPRGVPAFFEAFVFLMGSYTPWMLATPILLQLSSRWVVGVGRSPRHLAFLAGTGLLAIPLLTALGGLVGQVLVRTLDMGGSAPLDLRASRSALVATTLFAIPLYLAVVGIGQLLAHAALRRERERVLARLNEEALRSRLQQHFLFNALSAIGELGYRDAARADRALGHVAGLLRALLERPAEVALRDEIGAAADFIELHQLLTRDVALDIEVEPAAWNARVPSMILQPLLENALQHGLPDALASGIRIKATVTDGSLMLSVENRVRHARPGGLGIGLDNLRKRLVLLYGSPATLTTQRDDHRFIATVRMPCVEAAPP